MKNSAQNVRERLETLLAEISKGICGKERECRLAMLATLAGESIILLGPPGVAKSMVARRMKMAFYGARSFEYLMNRFSSPDEIFGPVSISRLKSDDVYERNIEGYLPEADVVFLDEIWKAGPAIQNTLLTVINERIFRNGRTEMRLPLKLLVAASNELPAIGEGLEALWDRFLIRVVCRPIDDEEIFYTMLQMPIRDNGNDDGESLNAITPEEYALWQRKMASIALPRHVMLAISHIRHNLGRVEIEGSSVERSVYVSDRRWRHIMALLQASAFVAGNNEIGLSDLMILCHCLWNAPEEFNDVRQHVIKGIFSSMEECIKRLSDVAKADVRRANAMNAARTALQKMDDLDDRAIDRRLLIVDDFFFEVEGHGTGHTHIFISDFINMKVRQPENAAYDAVMYQDPTNRRRTIIARFNGTESEALPGVKKDNIKIYRDFEHLYINGVQYALRVREEGEGASIASEIAAASTASPLLSNADCAAELEAISAEKRKLTKDIHNNLFCPAEDVKAFDKYANSIGHGIAEVRGILAEIDRLI